MSPEELAELKERWREDSGDNDKDVFGLTIVLIIIMGIGHIYFGW